MKPSFDVSVNLVTREALYTPSLFNAERFGLPLDEPTPVDVFGLYQVNEDAESSDAYFVVELPDGRCCYAGVLEIQFIKYPEDAE